MDPRARHLAIVGAGPGDVCVSERPLAEGLDDVVPLERANGAGGKGRRDRDSSCESDVPCALYAFSASPEST
jgi:cation diffusion facilitator CzcD-associated flavoprotein CzcO